MYDIEARALLDIVNFRLSYFQDSSKPPTLDSIKLNIEGPKLVAIVGPVGSGKASILIEINMVPTASQCYNFIRIESQLLSVVTSQRHFGRTSAF